MEKFDDIKKSKLNRRPSVAFNTTKADSTRLEALLDKARDSHLWKDIFGETACAVDTVSTSNKGEDQTPTGKRERETRRTGANPRVSPTKHGPSND
jgi:hypothetical protein